MEKLSDLFINAALPPHTDAAAEILYMARKSRGEEWGERGSKGVWERQGRESKVKRDGKAARRDRETERQGRECDRERERERWRWGRLRESRSK